MEEKTKDSYDFSDFLLDDEFCKMVKDESSSDDYIAKLKAKFPSQGKNIEHAIQVLEVMENKYVQSTFLQRHKVWSEIVKAITNSESKVIRLNNRGENSPTIKIFYKIAAIFILLIGIGYAALYFSNEKDLEIDRFATSNEVDYKQPQLILSNGKKIVVPAGDATISYSPDGAKVTINDTSKVVQPVKEEQFNQIIVPYGKYVSLQLSDGSKVWLNSGSRMVYPPVFVGKQREVYLQGEGYFEVSKNAQKPFYVKTDRMKVEVLGTKFDVQAYENENIYSALLLEGKVSLSSRKKLNQEDIVLKQSERGALSETSNLFLVEKIEHPENFIAWTNGYLNFEDESLESLLKRISRYYDIDIHLVSNIGSFKISGKLDLKNDPERVLRGIAVIAKMKITKQEGGFTISN